MNELHVLVGCVTIILGIWWIGICFRYYLKFVEEYGENISNLGLTKIYLIASILFGKGALLSTAIWALKQIETGVGI